MAQRRAEATWEGNLTEGQGTIDSVGSGVLSGLPVSWRARTEDGDSQTSPEELLAAAEAACFSMACSNELNKAGYPPTRVQTRAVCTFDKKPEGGWKVGSMTLDVRGTVANIDPAEFERIAQAAAQSCPISTALKGNVAIHITARLEG
ncbi:MAG TPA: OsmC family peroxiredoxin [Chloroflexia bacterium]|nr:OsmC family peroxiredoxin [Chloroflexia bacterium]